MKDPVKKPMDATERKHAGQAKARAAKAAKRALSVPVVLGWGKK